MKNKYGTRVKQNQLEKHSESADLHQSSSLTTSTPLYPDYDSDSPHNWIVV